MSTLKAHQFQHRFTLITQPTSNPRHQLQHPSHQRPPLPTAHHTSTSREPHSSLITRGRCHRQVAVPAVPAAPAAVPRVLAPPPPLPHCNRTPRHAAARHKHTTPTPRQVRAGHYRCCSRRSRWGVPYLCPCSIRNVPTVDEGGTGKSGSGMPKPTGLVDHSGLL